MNLNELKQWLSTRQFKYRRWFGRRTWIVLGSLVVAYIYVLGDFGLYNLWVQKRRAEELRHEITALQAQRESLLQLKEQLKAQDPHYIEQIARERYGMVKKGETLYRVRPGEARGGSR